MASYQAERERFIYRVTKEGLDLNAAHTLLRCATTINRLAELACSSEAADRDRIPCPAMPRINNKGEIRETGEPCLCDRYYKGNPPDKGEPRHTSIPRITLQDYRATCHATRAVPPDWTVITEGDPRGYTLRVIPPSWAERNAGKDRFNLDAIGVPPGPSRLRW